MEKGGPKRTCIDRLGAVVQFQMGENRTMIRREGANVWIDLDEFYPPPHGHPNTVFKSMAIAFQAIGADVTYVDLMGISGAAFRIQVGNNFCPSSPHPHLGFQCDSRAQEALGYGFALHSCERDDAAGVERVKKAVVASIDSGRPVLMDEEETGLVVGFTDGGKDLLVRDPYSNKGDAPTQLEEWPWDFAVIAKTPHRASRDSIVDSLNVAVRMAHVEERLGNGYACGFAGYERWISELIDETIVAGSNPGGEVLILGNAHIYYCLVDARTCASEYLEGIQGEFSDKVAPHLAEAAALYREIAAKLDTGWDNVPWPWKLKSTADWTMQHRRNQASLLTDALVLERRAVAELKNAVALLE